MVLQVNEEFTTVIKVTDADGNPSSGKTISYKIYDETLTQYATGTMSEITGTAIYYKSWTPDTAGYWIFEVYYSGSDFKFYDVKLYAVRKGVEKWLYDTIGTPNYTTIVGDIANLITRTKGLDDIYDSVDEVEGLLKNVTYGLSALKAEIDANETKIDTIITRVGDPTGHTLTSIITKLGNPTQSLGALLEHATYGLAQLDAELDALENKLKASPTVDSILFKAGGAVCPTGRSIWDVLGDGTLNLDDIYTVLNDVFDDVGDVISKVDTLQSYVTALENKFKASPSVDSILFKSGGAVCPAGKSIWSALGDATVSLNTLNNLLTDATSGLAALNTDLDAIISSLGNETYGLSAIETLVDEVESLLKNETYGLSALETLVDELESLLKNETYGLSALETLVDEVESLLKDGTYGLSKLNDDLDAILADTSMIADATLPASPTAGSLARFIASGGTSLGTQLPAEKSLYDVIVLDRLDNATYGLNALYTNILALENKLKASPSVDSILFKSGGAVCPASKSIWDALGDGTVSLNTLNTLLTHGSYGLSALNDDLDGIIADIGTFPTANYNTLAAYVEDIRSRLITIAGYIDTEIADILADTNELELDWKDGGRLDLLIDSIITYVDCLPANFSTQVQSDVTTVLQTYHLDHLIQAASTVTGTPTPNFFDTNLAEATDDHYNGCIIIFTSGNLAGQASIIVDYNGTTKEITVDPAFVETPVSTDAFVILSNPMGALKIGSKGLDQIFDAIDQLFNLNRIGDSVTTDGTEQTLWIVDSPTFPFKPNKFIIDLTDMDTDDDITVKIYYRLKSGGNYILHTSQAYADGQDVDLKSFDLLPNTYGVKITITEDAGAHNTFDYEVYFEER